MLYVIWPLALQFRARGALTASLEEIAAHNDEHEATFGDNHDTLIAALMKLRTSVSAKK